MAETLKLASGGGPLYAEQGALFGDREIVGWRRGDLACELIERDLANDIIRQNHYSGKVYNASYVHLGAFWRDELVGVAQYGYAMNPASQGSVVAGTGVREYLELNRLWVSDLMPKNTESAFLRLTMKFIRATMPVKWVQSFADERCRRFGAVYQACSFLYCGEHTAVFWELDGVWFHNSLMTRNPDQTPAARHIQENRERAIPHNLRQFRYVKFLDKRARPNLLLPVLPYPKPAADVEETAPAIQSGGVGAMPTRRSAPSVGASGMSAREIAGRFKQIDKEAA